MDIGKLRVLQISAAYVGAQKQIEDAIYTNLCNHGIANKVLFWVGETNNCDFIKCENIIENRIRRFCYKYIKKSYIFSWAQTRRAIKYIDSFKPNVVHLHSIHHGYIHYPMLFDYLRDNGIKIIYTVHDMWPFTGGCYYYTNVQCTGFMNGCQECPNSLEDLDCSIKETEALYNKKIQCYEGQDITFVAVSDWVKEEVDKSVLRSYPCYVIKNCIDIQESETLTEPGLRKDIVDVLDNYKTLVFVAASWDKRKGYDIICSLAKLLGDEYRIILVGNVSEDLKRHATPNMILTGYLKHKNDLRLLYRLCNLHVSASTEETFGMTFVEAAFEGTKSIGFGCTAVKETIAGVGGVCVQANDIRSLYNAILEHIDEPKLTPEEINKIKVKYSKKTMADSYLMLYSKC